MVTRPLVVTTAGGVLWCREHRAWVIASLVPGYEGGGERNNNSQDMHHPAPTQLRFHPTVVTECGYVDT